MTQETIKVALPNKGALFEPTMEMLSACGYKVPRVLKSLSTQDAVNDVEFYFLRPRDIPIYVERGDLDAGITGKDFVFETATNLTHLLDLDYGKSKFRFAVPADKAGLGIEEFMHKKVATSFPNVLEKTLGFPRERIVRLEGAVEIAVKLGIADAVADVVETGTTLRQEGLVPIGKVLFESNAALYAHPGRGERPQLGVLKSRLQGRLVARAYMMVEYDVPAVHKDEACKLTPGIESPTVTPLQEPGWFSVKAVVKKDEVNSIMDRLLVIGCKGILLTAIESARI